MEVSYRGFDISVRREKSMAGYSLVYYDVFRQEDGWELTSGFSDSEDTVREFVKYMKTIVDDYYENPEEYEDEEEDY